MFSASAQTIPKVQLVTGIASLLGLFYFDLTAINCAILIASFYVYSIIGISLTFHRYYAHRSFEFKYPIVKWLFTLISIRDNSVVNDSVNSFVLCILSKFTLNGNFFKYSFSL